MEQVVVNMLRGDGMRYLKMIGDDQACFRRLLPRLPMVVHDRVQWEISADEGLGICTLELTWPVFEPYEVGYEGPRKFRRFMAVHLSYAARVSECIQLAVNEFMGRTGMFPRLAYVRDLPKGAENNMDVHGVILIESEFAPGNCVLVGGAG